MPFVSEKLENRETPIGQGVFARAAIAKDERLVDWSEVPRIDRPFGPWAVQVDVGEWMAPARVVLDMLREEQRAGDGHHRTAAERAAVRAWLSVVEFFSGWCDTHTAASAAREDAKEAVELGGGGRALHVLGVAQLIAGDAGDAAGTLERAVRAGATRDAFADLALALRVSGRREEAARSIDEAAVPADEAPPDWWAAAMSVLELAEGRTEAACSRLERVQRTWTLRTYTAELVRAVRSPDRDAATILSSVRAWTLGWVHLGAALVRLEARDRARETMKKMLEMDCYLNTRSLEKVLPFWAEAERAALLDELRAAGLPEVRAYADDDFLNHSCVPSAYVDFASGGMILRATRDLDSGAEITFDYNTLEYEREPFRCACPALGWSRLGECSGQIHGYRQTTAEYRRAIAPRTAPYLRRMP